MGFGAISWWASISFVSHVVAIDVANQVGVGVGVPRVYLSDRQARLAEEFGHLSQEILSWLVVLG